MGLFYKLPQARLFFFKVFNGFFFLATISSSHLGGPPRSFASDVSPLSKIPNGLLQESFGVIYATLYHEEHLMTRQRIYGSTRT